MSEPRTPYGRVSERRKSDKHTNGVVVRPFKSHVGEKEMFINKELVAVSRSEVPGAEEQVYIVTGVAYDAKKATFKMKAAMFNEGQLSKYVKVTGEITVIEGAKPRSYVTGFEARTDITALNGTIIPAGTFITKAHTIQGGGLLLNSITVEGYPEAILDEAKLALCKIVQPMAELTEAILPPKEIGKDYGL